MLIRKIKTGLLASLLVASGMAFSQVEVGVADVVGHPGETVEVEIYYLGNGDARTYQFDITVNDLTMVEGEETGIDVSRCLESAPSAPVEDCVVRSDPNLDTVRVGQASFTDPMPDIDPIGVVQYTISSTAQVGDVIDLSVTDYDVENVDDDDVVVKHGSIEVIEAADDGSELAVTPSSHDFGTINVGDSDSTTFTAENVGDADLDITDVSISGASQFTIANNGCNGQTLTPGDTCEVDVDFDGDAEGTYSAEITFESDADVNDEVVVEVTGEVVEDNGAEEGFTVDFDGGLGAGDAGDTVSSTGTVVYEGDTSATLSCELSGDPVFSSNPDPLDFTFAESGSEEFTISCTLPEDAEDGQDYSGLLSCTDEAGEEVYTQDLGCSVTADEPEPTPAVPVPTMQSWGIALFSLIMLAIGGLSIRAFRS